MAFHVFLSYSLDPNEMALAWRLQTLAAAHGIEMHVPRRSVPFDAKNKADVRAAIDRADCVLAIIRTKANKMVQDELRYALDCRKLVIPIVRKDLGGSPIVSQFQRVFYFSPSENPGTVETEIVDFLKGQKLSKANRQTLGALAALGLGLIVLFSLNKGR